MLTRLRQADRRLVTILLIVFVNMLGASMALPILPLYARREFDMSPRVITLLVSSFFAAQFLAAPTIGRLSDKYGRLPVLIVSQLGSAVSFVMLGLAGSVEILFLSRILDGITGGNIIVAQAYITDITPRKKRTQALGYIFAAFGLGFIFGPAIGGVLSAVFGARIPFLFAAAAATGVVVLTWRTLDETLSLEQRAANRETRRRDLEPRQLLGNRPLLLILLIGLISQFALGMLQATFALFGEAVLFVGYSERITNLGVGLLLAVVGLAQFFTQLVLLPRAVRRYPDAWLVITGTLLRTAGLFFYAIASSPWLAAAAALFFAPGMGLLMPSLQSQATGAVADELRGGVLGVYQSVISLATIISTAIAGTIFAVNPRAPYWVGLGLSLIAILPALTLWRRSDRRAIVTKQVSAGP